MNVGDEVTTLVWPQHLIELSIHVRELPIQERINHPVKEGFRGGFVGQVQDQQIERKCRDHTFLKCCRASCSWGLDCSQKGSPIKRGLNIPGNSRPLVNIRSALISLIICALDTVLISFAGSAIWTKSLGR